jgi:hypothetical protein
MSRSSSTSGPEPSDVICLQQTGSLSKHIKPGRAGPTREACKCHGPGCESLMKLRNGSICHRAMCKHAGQNRSSTIRMAKLELSDRS